MNTRIIFCLIFFILSVRAFKTKTCDHDKIITAVTNYNKCTVNAIKPTIGSLAMKAEEDVGENVVDQTCLLLKRDGPIMTCAKENLGECFETKKLEFNLKLTAQHALSMQPLCDDDDTQMEVDEDMFFAWLDLEDIKLDENRTECKEHAQEDANMEFVHCIEDTKDVKKLKEKATDDIMKCFDGIENLCFSEREMAFMRNDFVESFEDKITAIFTMGGLNMDDEKDNSPSPVSKDTGRNLENDDNQGSSASLIFKFSILVSIPVFLIL